MRTLTSHQKGGGFGKTKKGRGQISPLSGPWKPALGAHLGAWECQGPGVPAAPCSCLLQGPSTVLVAVGEYLAAGTGGERRRRRAGWGPGTNSLLRNKIELNPKLA